MKKMLLVLLVLALCFTMVTPALATRSFVPSITYKAIPQLVGPVDQNGMNVGQLNANGQTVGQLYLQNGQLVVRCDEVHPNGVDHDHPCIVITPYSEVHLSNDIPASARTTIQWVYEEILAQGMSFFNSCTGLQELIEAMLGMDKTVQDLVVRELFDVSVLCDELREWLEPEGNTICLDFDLGLAPGSFVAVATYKSDKWNLIEDTEIMDDGSVVCNTYENFCPVVVLVSANQQSDTAAVEEVNTGDSSNMSLWVAVSAASLLAIVVCFIGLRKTKKEQ